MPTLEAISVTSRTASLLIAPPGARFRLTEPLVWQLLCADGTVFAEGTTDSAIVFLEDLHPATSYLLHCDLGTLAFRTPECAGLIEATDHGVTADSADNSKAFAEAIAAVPAGGTLHLRPGRYVTKPIFLKPHMTLYLPKGAEIAATGDRSGWPILPARDGENRVLGTWEGLPESSFAALVTAVECEGLAIVGKGTIDGGGDRADWWDWPKETRDGARRPRTLHLVRCHDATLAGLTIRNSPSWTIHPYGCERLTACALHIENPPDSPNTDGLNPESCQDVRLIGLDISVGDDCIAIKSGKRGPGQVDHLAPTQNVTITHSRMERGHGAVVLGSEMSGGISGVEIRDCEFDGTDRGLRLKTRRGRGGAIEAVHMENVAMKAVATPLAINMFYFCDPDGKSDAVQSREPAPVSETTPAINDVSLTNVTAKGVSVAAAALLGLPEAPIRNVRLSNFAVSFDPDARAEVPLMALGVAPVRHGGVIAEFAKVSGDITRLTTQEEFVPC